MDKKKPKIIAIVGPTASGKTSLSIFLAKKFNGEVVSADSRQVYKWMDIGTGKIKKSEMKGIKHYLLDVISPKSQFSLGAYQKEAIKAIKEISKKGKLPFLVGGSPFYVYAVTDGLFIPAVKPNKELREKLNEKSEKELSQMLKKLDSERAEKIDKNNKRRLIRAIEIAKELGKVPKIKKNPIFKPLFIGIKREKEELKKLIKSRLIERLDEGMIEEVRNLRKKGVSWKKLYDFGLEYRWVSVYLREKITKEEMIGRLESDIWRFSRKQMTWFGKDKRIKWVKNKKEAENIIDSFLETP